MHLEPKFITSAHSLQIIEDMTLFPEYKYLHGSKAVQLIYGALRLSVLVLHAQNLVGMPLVIEDLPLNHA